MHSSYPSSLSVCDISANFGQNAMGSWLIYSSEKSSEINNVFSSDSLRPDLCGFRGYQRSVQTRYETCLPWKQSNIMWHIALYFREAYRFTRPYSPALPYTVRHYNSWCTYNSELNGIRETTAAILSCI